MKLLILWAMNALALLAVTEFVPGVHVSDFQSALLAALALGLVNTLIRPVLLFLSFPITLLTLGLFILVVNGLLFWWVGTLLRDFVVQDFWSGLQGAVLYSIFSWVLSAIATLFMRKS
jgi:putative membrane protein